MKSLDQRYIRLLLINMLLISCTGNKSPVDIASEDGSQLKADQIQVFDLKKLPELSTVRLSEIGAVDITYIPLKTYSQNMIAKINSVIFSKSYFLIWDNSNISMFQNDGSFITQVGIKGRGPEEFIGVSDIDINPKDESIYVCSGGQQKFLVYDKKGGFIRTFKSPLAGRMNFKFNKDGILCFYINDMGDITKNYFLIDTTGKVIKEYPNKYPWKRMAAGVFYNGENIFYRFKDQLLKKEIFCDTIFAYRNKVFEPYMVIDVGNQRLTPEIRSKIKTRSDAHDILNQYVNPWNLFEVGDIIYYEMGVTINGTNDLFAFIGSKKSDFRAMVVPYKGLINDLDGGPDIWLKTVKDDSTIASWIEAVKFREYVASDEFKNSDPRYLDKKEELDKLADSIQENDNPILIYIRLK